MTVDPRTPVLVGVGQAVSRWDGADAAGAPSPARLAAEAARAALADAGGGAALAGAIDVVAFVRTMLDSVAGVTPPFPQCANPPGALAQDLALHPRRAIYSEVGGDQPQALVAEAAELIFHGEAQAVLLAGAEATAAIKTARRGWVALDWSREVESEMEGRSEDRGLGPPLLSPYEVANGLGPPTQTYPAFEHALRARLGVGREAWIERMSQLWAGFSHVAAANPYAQFPVPREAAFLAEPSLENYPVADPYLKWHVAQDAVNQGAAVVLTSVGGADALGIAPGRRVFLHGYAKGRDRLVTERPDLSRSLAMELVLARALDSAGATAAELAEIDLYSCFPCAVFLAAEALGIDWRDRPLTVTGGLPFFGGAGNNYSMHAIATMVERLRARPGAKGLVLANGGFLSKEAAGVYATTPPDDWEPVSSAGLQSRLDAQAPPPLSERGGPARVQAYTVTWRKGAPQRGYVIGEQADGSRVLARVRTGHRATLAALLADDRLGRTVEVSRGDGVNLIEPSDRIGEAATSAGFMGRSFRYVTAERRGRVLEVTLNRPEAMNALHSAAHFELHELWDGFEADPDLWVAIVTGAGDRAFCSGNDLKATARGGDMTPAPTGFAGLCARFGREKPVIAAVKGVALGGGLEIVLACDLAVADERARMGLPEVKVGLFAAAGGVQRLTRQIGRKAATELVLTGRHIDAMEAQKLGIVNQVTPAGGALAAARELADAIASVSPSSVRASKQALNRLEEIEDLKGALEANGPIIARLMKTQDMREGVTAFAEKRAPRWVNR